MLDLDIGSRLDARAAGGKQEARGLLGIRRGIVLQREVIGRAQHAGQGVGLVVAKIGNQRRDRAIPIGDIGRGDHRRGDRRVGDLLVAAERHPFAIAFGQAGGDEARGLGQRAGALHAGGLAQALRQAVHQLQGFVVAAAILGGLHDHHELVAR